MEYFGQYQQTLTLLVCFFLLLWSAAAQLVLERARWSLHRGFQAEILQPLLGHRLFGFMQRQSPLYSILFSLAVWRITLLVCLLAFMAPAAALLIWTALVIGIRWILPPLIDYGGESPLSPTWIRSLPWFLIPSLPVAWLNSVMFQVKTGDRRIVDTDHHEASIQNWIDIAVNEGWIRERERDMVERVFDWRHATAREVMTPRVDMVCAESTDALEDIAKLATETRHTCVPIYEGDSDHLVGFVHVRDLLENINNNENDLKDVLQSVLFVPESRKLDSILRIFKGHHNKIAIVVDEYGGTSGMVTLEDVIEGLVGEILQEDESDRAEIEEIRSGVWRVDGHASVDEVAQTLDCRLSEGDYETIGGWLVTAIERLPNTGEDFTIDGLHVEILKADERRIEGMLLRKSTSGGRAGSVAERKR